MMYGNDSSFLGVSSSSRSDFRPYSASSTRSSSSMSRTSSASPQNKSPIVFKQFDRGVQSKIEAIANFKLVNGLYRIGLVQLMIDLSLIYLRSNALNSSLNHLSEALNLHTKLIGDVGYEKLYYIESPYLLSESTITPTKGAIIHQSKKISPIKHEPSVLNRKIEIFRNRCTIMSHTILIGMSMCQLKRGQLDIAQKILLKLLPIVEQEKQYEICFSAKYLLTIVYQKKGDILPMKESLKDIQETFKSKLDSSRKDDEIKKMILYLWLKLYLERKDVGNALDVVIELLILGENVASEDKVFHLFKMMLSIVAKYGIHHEKALPFLEKYLPSILEFNFDSNLPKNYKRLLFDIYIDSSVILVQVELLEAAYEVLKGLDIALQSERLKLRHEFDFISFLEEADYLRKLGTVCLSLNKYEEGIMWLKRAAILYASNLGKSHQLTKSIIQKIAQIIYHLGEN